MNAFAANIYFHDKVTYALVDFIFTVFLLLSGHGANCVFFFCRSPKRSRGRAPKIRVRSFEPIQRMDRATIWINLASRVSGICCWHARKLTVSCSFGTMTQNSCANMLTRRRILCKRSWKWSINSRRKSIARGGFISNNFFCKQEWKKNLAYRIAQIFTKSAIVGVACILSDTRHINGRNITPIHKADDHSTWISIWIKVGHIGRRVFRVSHKNSSYRARCIYDSALSNGILYVKITSGCPESRLKSRFSIHSRFIVLQ